MKIASWLCVGALLLLALASCASDKTGADLRKEGYDAIAKNIKPGMYRRQLYALLPPMRTPVAEPPQLDPMLFSLPPNPTFHFGHREKHELDDECYLVVHYQLKDGSEYANPKRKKLPARKSVTPGPVTPDSIDALLSDITQTSLDWTASSPFKQGPTPSRENPDDIITQISQTHIERPPGPDFTFGTSLYPTQEIYRYGRAMPDQKSAAEKIASLLPPPAAATTNDFPFTAGSPQHKPKRHRISEVPFKK